MSRKGIMLCYPFEEKRLKKWPTPYLVQPKLDGDRCRAISDEHGYFTLYSSEENIIESVPHIVYELDSLGLPDTELDGELYIHGEAHQDLRSIISRTVNPHDNFESMQYHVFDIVSSRGVVNIEDSQLIRTDRMYDLPLKDKSHLQFVATHVARSLADVMGCMADFIKSGYEGIVVRHPYFPYIRKRSIGMMKFKPRKDDFYTIIGYEEEISIEGIPKNSLGALWLSSGLGEEKFKVGTGSFLTRERREQLWPIRESLVNKIAHVKYQHLTERRVPRFPVLVDIIEVKDGN